MMRRPDFFIVGAPKSGTSSLADWLQQHPQVFMPKREMSFFGKDLDIRRSILSIEQYFDFLREAEGAARVGEKSVVYLYSKTAPYEIEEFNDEAQILIILRNPVDMVYSLHSQAVRMGVETEFDFAAAWELQYDREQGKKIPKNTPVPMFLLYRRMGKYYEPVKRYLEVFGSRLLVMIFEKVMSDPLGHYRETLRFLGLDDVFTPVFTHENPYTEIRSRIFHQVMTKTVRIPVVALRLARLLVPVSVRGALRLRIMRANFKPANRPALSGEIRDMVAREFIDDIEPLSAMLGEDLVNLWLEGGGKSL